jgi:hypothetical protein
MEELVWRKKGDEGCIKSYRPTLTTTNQPTLPTEKKALPEEFRKFTDVATVATEARGVGGAIPQLNRREEVSAKMNERHLVGQSTQNPFMPNSNYAHDLEAQMNFLSPKQL